MRENKRKQIHRVFDGSLGGRALARPAMTFTHSFKEDRLIAAEMNESCIRDCRKDIQEFAPYKLLVVLVVCPKAMLNSTIAGFDANADKVVEIAIRHTFDIQIDQRAVEFRIQEIESVNLVLADRECPQ